MTGRDLIILAAGGTGGHVFPALALGQALLARGYRVALVTDNRGAAYPGLTDEIPRHVIAAGHLGGGMGARVRGVARLAQGFLQSARLLLSLRPIAVVGFGGYPSLPMMLAAGWTRRVTVIHEQNALLGTANRLAARQARAVALSVADTAGVTGAAAARSRVIGNPVRSEIAALAGAGYSIADDAPINLLITGGSQGAQIFGDVVPAAIGLLTPAQRGRLNITQQCREADIESVQSRYRELGVTADVRPFVDDMARALSTAHLVICRAGASTAAELTAAGRPAILVPLPTAAADHQTANAAALADSGAAWLLPQADATAETLARQLAEMLEKPQILAAAAAKSAALARPDAAMQLADLVVQAASARGRRAATGAGGNIAASDNADTKLCEAVR